MFTRHTLVVLATLINLAIAADASAQRAVGQASQLTHAQTYDPSFSPDGSRMVYISNIGGREQLFIMNTDGTGSHQITHDDAHHEDPAWSPDGKSIAFVYVKDRLEVISLMNADGTGTTERVSPETQRAIHPHWSPDGAKLAWCTDDDLAPPRKNDSDIMVLDMSTRRISTLITGGVNTYPSFSPDGRHIAFRRMLGEMNSEVFVANSDGSDIHNVTNHPAFDGWPAWSPDGTELAFASNRNWNYQIFAMKADGSEVRLLANTEGRATGPVWSKDGRRVFFSNCRKADTGTDCEIFSVEARRGER